MGITVSVISSQKIAQAINDINNLSNHLLLTVNNVPSSLLMAVAADSTSKFGIFGNNTSGQVDVSGLLFHVREKFPVLGQLTYDAQKSLKDAILYNIRGDSKPNATGLSIYMPISSEQFNSYSSNYGLNAWQNVIDNQEMLLKQNKEEPYINAYIDRGTIKGHIIGGGVSTLVVAYVNSSSLAAKNKSLFYVTAITGPNILRPVISLLIQSIEESHSAISTTALF
jgi:hypothetical protein